MNATIQRTSKAIKLLRLGSWLAAVGGAVVAVVGVGRDSTQLIIGGLLACVGGLVVRGFTRVAIWWCHD